MKNKQSSFEKEILLAGIIPNLLSSVFIYFYSIFVLQTNLKTIFIFFFVALALIAVAQIIFAPLTNIFISRKLSQKIEVWKKGGMTCEERTSLFKEIQSYPFKKQLETFVYFFVCTIILALAYKLILKLDLLSNLISIFGCLFGTYIACLLALSFSVKICSRYAEQIVSQGIDDNEVQQKKIFGLTFGKSIVMYVILPIVICTALFVVTFILYYLKSFSHGKIGSADLWSQVSVAQKKMSLTSNQFIRIAVLIVVNICALSVLVFSFFKRISDESKLIQTSMTHIIENDIFTVDLIPTDVSNEIYYNMYLVNRVIIMFRSVLDRVREIGANISSPVQLLTETANETASTSLEQSTGVKEILATMEDNDAQTRGIVAKISDVTKISERTTANVETGFATLKENLNKMNEITQANVATINGIKALGEKIESIWEIVNIINDIADQTRIIAFNAELEASEAGDAGRNFHIVANEVRRLAAGITDSVAQIRERITEIQHSSDNLIITSESGTEKIREGCELTENLESKFSDIKSSSEITAESAADIQNIIQQQSAAFDQIVATIRQISAGIENFSASTSTVNAATDRLKIAADRLENLHREVISAEK